MVRRVWGAFPPARVARPAPAASAQDEGPQPAAGALEDDDHGDAEDDDFEIAALAEELRQPVPQPLLEDGDEPGAHHRAPDVADAADHRHEEVFDALGQEKASDLQSALQMGVEPAGNARQQGGDEKDDDLGARVSTPSPRPSRRLPRARMARPRANRAGWDGPDGEQDGGPDEVERSRPDFNSNPKRRWREYW